MTRISTMQIVEILDEVRTLSFEKSDTYEDHFVVACRDKDGKLIDSDLGTDLGQLVDELHARL